MWDRYFTPNTIEVAVDLLSKHQGRARIVAGATDLLLELQRGLRPDVRTLIDITRIKGLDHINQDDDGWVHLGPLVTHNHCAASKIIREYAFALARACWEVGAPQIRNRGTIVGNLVTASPANDSIPALLALDAQLTLRSSSGERVVPLESFYTGVRQTVLRPDELVVDVAFRGLPPPAHSTFVKLGLRRAQAISVVNAAVVLDWDGDRVKSARIALGSVAPTVVRAPDAERFLQGKILSEDDMAEASKLAAAHAHPIDDLRSSAAYRAEMVRTCVLRGLRALSSGLEAQGYPDEPVMLWGREKFYVLGGLDESSEHHPGAVIETKINGTAHSFDTGFEKTLLQLLREEASLIGTKEGCAEGECGACTVFLDGVAVMACLVPAPRAHWAEITTIEGIASGDQLHPLQQAFLDEGAVQCGYCTPGFIMSGVKLLEERPHPRRTDIVQAMTGNLCRCTGYYKIITAVERAAAALEP